MTVLGSDLVCCPLLHKLIALRLQWKLSRKEILPAESAALSWLTGILMPLDNNMLIIKMVSEEQKMNQEVVLSQVSCLTLTCASEAGGKRYFREGSC